MFYAPIAAVKIKRVGKVFVRGALTPRSAHPASFPPHYPAPHSAARGVGRSAAKRISHRSQRKRSAAGPGAPSNKCGARRGPPPMSGTFGLAVGAVLVLLLAQQAAQHRLVPLHVAHRFPRHGAAAAARPRVTAPPSRAPATSCFRPALWAGRRGEEPMAGGGGALRPPLVTSLSSLALIRLRCVRARRQPMGGRRGDGGGGMNGQSRGALGTSWGAGGDVGWMCGGAAIEGRWVSGGCWWIYGVYGGLGVVGWGSAWGVVRGMGVVGWGCRGGAGWLWGCAGGAGGLGIHGRAEELGSGRLGVGVGGCMEGCG